jgi:hypothetical protein
LKTALTYLAEVPPDPTGAARDPRQVERENLQDLIWALINTKEFQFNH